MTMNINRIGPMSVLCSSANKKLKSKVPIAHLPIWRLSINFAKQFGKIFDPFAPLFALPNL
jgi:hypothetical protein